MADAAIQATTKLADLTSLIVDHGVSLEFRSHLPFTHGYSCLLSTTFVDRRPSRRLTDTPVADWKRPQGRLRSTEILAPAD